MVRPPTTRRLLRLLTRETYQLALASVALAILILAGVGWLLIESRRAAYDSSVRSAENVILSLESNVRHTVEVLDLSLQAAIHGSELPELPLLGPAARNAVLFDGAIEAEEYDGLVVTDASGRLVHDSRSATPRDIDVAKRNYFRAHQSDPLLGLLISGRSSDQAGEGTALALSRRINNPDGSFAGIAVGFIKPEAFTRLFAAVNTPTSNIGLFTLDGRMLIREPALASYAELAEKGAVFRELRKSSPDQFTTGVLTPGPSLVDGIRRVIVYRRIGPLPIGISLSILESEAYAGWAERAILIAIGLMLLTAMAGALAWGLSRELVRRSRAERKALDSAAEVRLLTDNSCDMIVRLDWDGIRHYVSAASLSVLGRPPAELVGRNCVEFIQPDDRVLIQSSLLDLKHDGAFPTTVVRISLPNGAERHVEAQGRALPDGTGAILVVRDITARIQMEERLRQSHRMEALGQLTAGVAHDFNNMLQAQLGCLEMLIDELPGLPGPRRLAQQALQLGERGARLTNQLLSFSRQQILFPEAILLNDFLAGLTDTLRRTLAPGIRVMCTVQPATPPLFADRAHLESALLNLSLNARDAMPEGGTIRIEASGQANEDCIVLSVRDEGTGMEPTILERACEPFFTTKGLNGTGLGLASVLGFANQSGGALSIRSTPGQGTTIQLTLPRASGILECTSLQNPQIPVGGRILVVDDTPEVLFAVTATLESGGFDVAYVPGPAQALEALAEDGPFDCLVTDYAMPGMNGGDLVQAAQQLCPAMPALIITGWADIEALERLGGATEVLRKPFKRDALLEHVRRLISDTIKRPKQMQFLEED